MARRVRYELSTDGLAQLNSRRKSHAKRYDEMLKIDNDKMAVKKSIDLLLHLLHDYIPRSSFRDAERALYDAFEKDGIELTSKLMRKEYEAWKSTQLEGLHTLPAVPKS